MTEKDKLIITRFITRTGMYIWPTNENTIISFISGYETGRYGKCNFTELVRKYLEENFSVPYSSDGWNGQISRYVKKRKISWVVAFKQITLEIFASKQYGGLSNKMKECVKSRVVNLIANIQNPWFDQHQSWDEEWVSLCTIRSDWFKNLWTPKEYSIINSITQRVKKQEAIDEKETEKPTVKLLELSKRFELI